MQLAELRERAARVLDEVERAVVGKRDALEIVLLAILCDGHVLLEDYPGLAKTLAARSFASATSLRVSRNLSTWMPGCPRRPRTRIASSPEVGNRGNDGSRRSGSQRRFSHPGKFRLNPF